MKNNLIKTLISTAMILVPSMAFASSAHIGSVRGSLSPKELNALHYEENKFQRHGIKIEYINREISIGSMRANLSESEARDLYFDENKGQKHIQNNINYNSTATIGSLRAGLDKAELSKLQSEEAKGK